MIFQKREYHKKSAGPFVIFRLLLSLVMFLILGLGLYQAFRYFSGLDPLRMDPQGLVMLLISSDKRSMIVDDLTKGQLNKLPQDLQELLASQNLSSLSADNPNSTDSQVEGTAQTNSDSVNLLKFAVVSDSHLDNTDLAKALRKAGRLGAKFVIGLGDYTDTGTLDELKTVKETFDTSGLHYYLTAGDHDLWAAREKKLDPASYFKQVFGTPYQSFADSNIRFIILYNSDNYDGVDNLQMHWLEDEISRVSQTQPILTLAFLHEPLYHPSSDHVMGIGNSKLFDQAQQISKTLKNGSVGGVFAGHTHFFSEYQDPGAGLKEIAVGAVTKTPNIQSPRFVMVDVKEDGSYNVEDLEIDK